MMLVIVAAATAVTGGQPVLTNLPQQEGETPDIQVQPEALVFTNGTDGRTRRLSPCAASATRR